MHPTNTNFQHVASTPSLKTEIVCVHRLVGQLSQIQQQLAQPGCNHKAQGTMQELSLSAGADRLGICFVIATVQVETAAQVLKVPSPAKVHA